jgi:hypothetical protein
MKIDEATSPGARSYFETSYETVCFGRFQRPLFGSLAEAATYSSWPVSDVDRQKAGADPKRTSDHKDHSWLQFDSYVEHTIRRKRPDLPLPFQLICRVTAFRRACSKHMEFYVGVIHSL